MKLSSKNSKPFYPANYKKKNTVLVTKAPHDLEVSSLHSMKQPNLMKYPMISGREELNKDHLALS
jgi:hypothetical protein